ncbi:MAG: deoxyribodipyrimidine photolyase [Euryarchaeota archaeon]|mgnify:CR=1 FL=1|nr:deoxyribodipyrimidine photolyase [Euryarchaeota archaeon]|tara:strand:- start:41652 stop:43196 length:1545 start_codon:yes stop_codon:yes gene_type:complete
MHELKEQCQVVHYVPVTVVWFKRDLRISDHPALDSAIKSDLPVICLFNLEPERIQRDDVDSIHIEWELDCLRKLQRSLESIGGKLLFHYGRAVDRLEQLHTDYHIDHLYSSEETGLQWSWDRDKDVAKWSKSSGVEFTEFPTNGVIRGLKSRDHWKALRDHRVDAPLVNTPVQMKAPDGLQSDTVPLLSELGIPSRSLTDRPEPGEKAALAVLFSFLDGRGRTYRKSMSSPLLGKEACSRLSPYIAVGCISIRQILHHTRRKLAKVKKHPRSADNRGWTTSLSSFQSRLAWHCHFIQRLEHEATMDSIALNPELDEQLERIFDQEKFDAWAYGFTGWPFFDACMRSLIATGWINFRMRAMLQSVASYTLWLPWRETGMHMARMFLDYEPGIHWSQIHMQSGVTGINSIRAYSVEKQAMDHDPTGEFIRTWVKELRDVPEQYIHHPWRMTEEQQKTFSCRIGKDYPAPIVDEKESRKEGISAAYGAKGHPAAKTRATQVYLIHGSRKRQQSARRS